MKYLDQLLAFDNFFFFVFWDKYAGFSINISWLNKFCQFFIQIYNIKAMHVMLKQNLLFFSDL